MRLVLTDGRRPASDIEGREALQLGGQAFHIISLGEIHGQEDALVVVGGDDHVLRAVDAVAIFLGLVAGEDDLGVDLFGEERHAARRDVAAPDELIDRAGLSRIIGAGQFAIEDGVIEGFDLRVVGEAVATEDAIGGGHTASGNERKNSFMAISTLSDWSPNAFLTPAEKASQTLGRPS